MSLLQPDLYLSRIDQVTLPLLRQHGIAGLLLDVDNTLALHNDPNLPDFVSAWLERMKQNRIPMVIVSNNDAKRVAPFAEKVGLPFISTALKPLPYGFSRGVRKLGLQKSQVAAIGDQLFTDLLGANLCRITSILLDPIKEEPSGFLAAKRKKQKAYLMKHGLKPQDQEQASDAS